MPGDLGSLVVHLAANLSDLKRGLLEGKAELSGLRNFTEKTAGEIKKLLAFAGISLGFYELISQVKAFGSSVLEEGGKVERLKAATMGLADYYKISAAAIDLYVQKLQDKKIEDDIALESINSFLKAGISIDKLPQLADAAKVLGASMGLPLEEAFRNLVQGIVKGTPKQLAEMVPGIQSILQAMSSSSKSVLDTMILSGTEKSEILLQAVLSASEKIKGANEDLNNSYLAQQAAYKLKIREVKDALFEFAKPIGMAITKEQIQTWDDFYLAIGNNKQALHDLGETVAVYIGRLASFVRNITEFTAAHKDLLIALLEIITVLKVVRFFAITEGAAAASVAIGKTITQLTALRLALAGPWGLVIAVSLVGLYEALAQLREINIPLQEKLRQDKKAQFHTPPAPQNIKDLTTLRPATAKEMKELAGLPGPPSVTLFDEEMGRMGRELSAKGQVDRAAEERKKEADALMPKGKGGGGGQAEQAEDLYGEGLRLREAERQAKMQAAQDDLDLLKATNEKKRAELEKQLAEGLIDGQEYYAKLQEYQKAETDKAVSLIDVKKNAQKQAYQDALAAIQQQVDQGGISPEMAEIKRQEEAAKNRMTLAQLDAEAARVKLDGEKKVTEELRRQVELRQKYSTETSKLNIETGQLLGAISEQEANLRKLYLEWQESKRQALKEGASPEYFAALEKNFQARQANVQYGGYAQSIVQGFSSLIDSLGQAGADLKKTLNDFFKSLFKESLKPGLQQLQQLLVNGFKELFGEAGASIAGSVLGALALIGMMLTSATSSSYSSESLQGGVTASEYVRGIIAGPTSIPIAQIGESLQDALVPTNGILKQIEVNTRGGSGGGGGPITVNLSATSPEYIKDIIEEYFREYLLRGGT